MPAFLGIHLLLLIRPFFLLSIFVLRRASYVHLDKVFRPRLLFAFSVSSHYASSDGFESLLSSLLSLLESQVCFSCFFRLKSLLLFNFQLFLVWKRQLNAKLGVFLTRFEHHVQNPKFLFAWSVLRVQLWFYEALLRWKDCEAGLPLECPTGVLFGDIGVILADADEKISGVPIMDLETDGANPMLSVNICSDWQAVDDLDYCPRLVILLGIEHLSIFENVDKGRLVECFVVQSMSRDGSFDLLLLESSILLDLRGCCDS